MKQLTTILLTMLLLMSCETKKKEANTSSDQEKKEKEITPVSAEMMESAVIYEANIRQYSEEGSFDAFTKDIPQLKELGVKVIWLMPIFPISETKRKATGDQFVSDIEDEEERKKYLGSYYAVSDFTKINPEFGTIEDFRELVKTAHDNDIYVILDWVPNHTGWDHTWLKTNPEFYTKNAEGEITDPLNEDGTPVGWADVADLNYDNKELRKAMIKDMKYWLAEENVDGFRCDVAGSVPTDFWEEAIPQLRETRDIFMLAEAWEPELMTGKLFDMAYGWDTHHRLNHIAQGEETVSDWDKRMQEIDSLYEDDDILMNFVTNHDENSWNGTIEERMGDAGPAMTALIYAAPGMPLIYSGQEYDMKHRLKFFEKDQIPKEKGAMWPLLEKLGELKNTNVALHGGKNAASYTKLTASEADKVLVFQREKEGKKVYYIGNLSKDAVITKIDLAGSFTNYMTGDTVIFREGQDVALQPWQYMILTAE